jgi:hypothetical protein
MNYRNHLTKTLLLVMLSAACSTGCYKMQKSWEHQPVTVDPHTYMSAWEFMQSRGINGVKDTLFSLMMRGVQYAGLEAEYQKPGRTFIFLQTAAIRGGVDAYWTQYQVDDVDQLGIPITRPAVTWEDYPVEQVKNYFRWLIIQGEYSYENVGSNNVFVKTLLTEGVDPNNPTGEMGIRNYPGPQSTDLRNTKLWLNAYLNAPRPVDVVSGGYICTNGYVHTVQKAPW